MSRWIGLLLCVASCSTGHQVKEPLADAVRKYHEGVRWKRHARAAAKIAPERRHMFLDLMSELEGDVNLHHYEVIRVRFSPQGSQAKVQVRVQWYLDSKGTLHKTQVVQDWRRLGSGWVLSRESHLRGKPLPTTDVLSKPVKEQEPFDPAPNGHVKSKQRGGAS